MREAMRADRIVRNMHGAKARILDGAIRQVAAHGWNVPIAQIAVAAKCNDLTVYRNFGDKENLLREVMYECARRSPIPPCLSDALGREPVPPLDELLPECVRVMLEEKNRDHYRVFYYACLQRPDILAEWDAKRIADGQDTQTLLHKYVERLQAQGMFTRDMEPDDAARKLHSLIHGSFMRNILMSGLHNCDPDPIEAMRTLCRLLQRVP